MSSYKCTIGKDGRQYWHKDGKRISKKNVPKEVLDTHEPHNGCSLPPPEKKNISSKVEEVDYKKLIPEIKIGGMGELDDSEPFLRFYTGDKETALLKAFEEECEGSYFGSSEARKSDRESGLDLFAFDECPNHPLYNDLTREQKLKLARTYMNDTEQFFGYGTLRLGLEFFQPFIDQITSLKNEITRLTLGE